MTPARAVAQRLNNAFVSVPPSPISLDQYRPLKGTQLHASTKLKENIPLPPFYVSILQSYPSSSSHKRKMDDRDQPSHTIASATKKAKHTVTSSSTAKQTQHAPEEEYPNGFIYCHQCNRKRDLQVSVQCTSLKPRATAAGAQERRCLVKYCKSCLMNHYGESVDDIKAQTRNARTQSGHVVGEGYIFKCPRCRDICDCSKCKRAKGLEPLSALQGKADNPKREKKSKTQVIKETAVTPAVQKAILKKSKPKALPTLKWTAILANLSQAEAEERICIREFFQRFGRIMDPPIAKGHLEELETISGRKKLRDDNDELAGWISEPCLKAIVLGLLECLANDHENNIAKIIKLHVKELRSAGMNLNKIWKILADMRETIANSTSNEVSGRPQAVLTFPNPLPPPASANIRATRSIAGTSTISVCHTAQMIPVILSLINLALETAAARKEMEQGIKDSKDAARDAREAAKRENDQWEQARKPAEHTIIKTTNKGKEKDAKQTQENVEKRMLHKARLLNIDNALKIVTSGFAPRFSALGADHEGRMYYALRPGYPEREAALEYLEALSSDKPTKVKRKARNIGDTKREELTEWSWFIAVWGKKPQATPARTAGHDKSSDGEGGESWWALGESEEILKVADWITIKCGLEDEEDVTTAPSSSTPKLNKRKMDELKQLVLDLRAYAGLLEWRSRETLLNELRTLEDKGLEQQRIDAQGIPKAAPIPTSRFYGA